MKPIVKICIQAFAPFIAKYPVKTAVGQTLLSCFMIAALSILAPAAYSQTGQEQGKITIAILPFVQSGGSGEFDKNAIENTVTKEYVDRKRFSIVDRSKFDAVLKELNIQKSDEFLNSKIIEQGRQSAAKYLVTGVVTDMRVEQKQVTNNTASTGTSIWNAFHTKDKIANAAPVTETVYQGYLHLAFQIIDVATGTAVYQEIIPVTSRQSSNKDDVATSTMCHLQHLVRKAIQTEFPEEIAILQVEEKDKKGFPKTVLINAGTNMFSEGLAPESACDASGWNIFGSGHDKPKLTLFETEVFTAAGKEYHREKPVGVLEVTSVEGETSVCRVKDGEKAIQDAITNNKTLGIKIQ